MLQFLRMYIDPKKIKEGDAEWEARYMIIQYLKYTFPENKEYEILGHIAVGKGLFVPDESASCEVKPELRTVAGINSYLRKFFGASAYLKYVISLQNTLGEKTYTDKDLAHIKSMAHMASAALPFRNTDPDVCKDTVNGCDCRGEFATCVLDVGEDLGMYDSKTVCTPDNQFIYILDIV